MATRADNNMVRWPQIACQRGHAEHASRQVTVTLGGPTAYADLSPIPERLGRTFDMLVWDTERHPVDGGAYCPAADCVSDTIASLGVWVPDETTLALGAMDGHGGELAVDFGAQVGWFSLLAASCGLRVVAVEADPDNARLLAGNAALNGWDGLVDVLAVRVDPSTPAFRAMPVRLAKLDVEGAEDQCLRLLRPSIDAGLVDHLLIEVTPFFDDYWPDALADLADAGYRLFTLPPKQRPPVDLADWETALAPFEVDGTDRVRLMDTVAGWTEQVMVWAARRGVEW